MIEASDNIIFIYSKITSTKLYVAVVTMSIHDNIRFLEHLKQGFERTMSWNKCRSNFGKYDMPLVEIKDFNVLAINRFTKNP